MVFGISHRHSGTRFPRQTRNLMQRNHANFEVAAGTPRRLPLGIFIDCAGVVALRYPMKTTVTVTVAQHVKHRSFSTTLKIKQQH